MFVRLDERCGVLLYTLRRSHPLVANPVSSFIRTATFLTMGDEAFQHFEELSPQELEVLAQTPAITPPPGIVSNFEHPPTNVQLFYVVASLLLALSIIFLGSRVYQKLRIIGRLSADDCECKRLCLMTVVLTLIR